MSKNQDLKERLTKYGILIGYSFIGIIGLGIFSFKTIMIRLANMEQIKQKSRIPTVHTNMRKNLIIGFVGATLYTYGMWQIIKDMPGDTNNQMGDYTLLSDVNRKNLLLQDHYIIQTMKYFGVSDRLIDKTKQQFKRINEQQLKIKPAQQKPNLSKQLFFALLQHQKISKQYLEQNANKQTNFKSQNK